MQPEALGNWGPDLWIRLGALGLIGLVLAYALYRLLVYRRKPPEPQQPDLAIDVAGLPALRPPVGGPGLYLANVPMRLAVVVLAPAGRIRELPPLEELGAVLESVVPGLNDVVATHSPLVRYWPRQLSPRGFAQLFFNNVRLPGQKGKGTNWCSVAGVFKVENQPMMIGLLMRSERPTSLGQVTVEHEAQWLDLVRIK